MHFTALDQLLQEGDIFQVTAPGHGLEGKNFLVFDQKGPAFVVIELREGAEFQGMYPSNNVAYRKRGNLPIFQLKYGDSGEISLEHFARDIVPYLAENVGNIEQAQYRDLAIERYERGPLSYTQAIVVGSSPYAHIGVPPPQARFTLDRNGGVFLQLYLDLRRFFGREDKISTLTSEITSKKLKKNEAGQLHESFARLHILPQGKLSAGSHAFKTLYVLPPEAQVRTQGLEPFPSVDRAYQRLEKLASELSTEYHTEIRLLRSTVFM